ncbi:MAG: NADH-quinone oxidoreductase subunit C [Acidobacteriota bacterium]
MAGAPPAEMAAIPWDDGLTKSLSAKFGARIAQFATYLGQNFLVVEAGAILELFDVLRADWEFDSLVDVTVVDYPARQARFELVYTLYSFARNERLRVKSAVAVGEKAPSVCHIFPTSNWLEREIYDMFGVEFAGHPDLRRLLLPEDWEGFPLRKDGSILAMDNRWVKENLGIESGQ